MRPGWRRWLIAFLLGVVSAAALPPVYLIPVLWVGLGGLALISATAGTWRQAAFEGWLFGVGWFGFGLYWIGYAFLVDAAHYAWMMPFAVLGVAVGMALFIALVTVALNVLVRRCGVGSLGLAPAFAGCWTIAEWLRGWVLTGFPWNPLGSVWGDSAHVVQTVAWLGTLGLGFLTALVFAAPVALVGRPHGAAGRPALYWVLGLSLILPMLWTFGAVRLDAAGTMTRDGVVLRLVQPAIAQADKWQPALRQGHVIRQMAMSHRTSGPAGTPTDVIWAETNVPYLIGPDSEVPASLAAAVPPGGHLIFGAPRRDGAGAVYNSLFVIDDDGKIAATFDKFHLVPFGEYIPLRGILPFDKLTEGRGDFAAGPGPRTLHVDGLPPFAAIICYEVIFSGRIVDPTDRPAWILNITNDAWFGPSTGPRQHLVQARLRAIEEGLPVVRAANTGISAVIDAYGRTRNSLDLDVQGVVDAPLPEALSPTIFSYLGQWVGLALAVAALLASGHRAIAARRLLGD